MFILYAVISLPNFLPSFASVVRSVLGENGVVQGEDDLQQYNTDWMVRIHIYNLFAVFVYVCVPVCCEGDWRDWERVRESHNEKDDCA